LKNLALKYKLAIISLLPLTFFLLLSFNTGIADYSVYKSYNKLSDQSKIVKSSSPLVNRLQIERGLSISFISGGDFSALLKNVQKKTDEKIKNFLEIESISKNENYIYALKKFKKISEIRRKVLNKSISKKSLFTFYTDLVSSLIDIQLDITHQTNVGKILSSYNQLYSLEQAKEKTGLLRATLSALLAKKDNVDKESLSAIVKKLHSAESFLTQSLIKRSKLSSKMVDEFFKSTGWKNTTKIIRTLQTSHDFEYDSKTYFQEISESISILMKNIEVLHFQLDRETRDLIEKNYRRLLLNLIVVSLVIVFTIVITAFVGISLFKELKNNIHTLNDCSSSVTSNAMQVSESSEQLASIAIQQSEALHQTVSAIDEITAMVSKSESNSQRSIEIASESESTTSSGVDHIKKVQSSINEINQTNINIGEQVERSNNDFLEIIKVIEEITDKTKVIDEIVFQTKLLSFNASVEAARAGTHGKGFAVVAEEVGNLASMSGKASSEISKILDSSINKVNEILNNNKKNISHLMAISNKKIEEGISSVKSCTESFDDIYKNVSMVSSIVSQITQATKEQNFGIQEVSSAVNALDQNTQQSSLISKQSNEVSKRLNKESNVLIELVNSMSEMMYGKDSGHRIEAAQIEWGSQYFVGVDAIDSEHTILVKKINHFVDSINFKSKEEYIQAFDEVVSYTVEHFTHEEELQRSSDYLEYPAHKKIHDKLLKTMNEYQVLLKNDEVEFAKLVGFLKNWLLSHIMGVDMQFAKHLNSSDGIDQAI